MVFDSQWFEQNQKKLLWLLNTPIIKYWFRWCLRIRRHDCTSRIIKIEPNKYWFQDENIYVDIRTHNKFSKRLYYAFKPFWYLLHGVDFLLNRAKFQYNFGFDTLTAYPDASSGGTTVDGVVGRVEVDETFATIRAGAGNGFDVTGTEDYFCGLDATTTTDQFANLIRGIYTFDTSNLRWSEVSSVTLSLFGQGTHYVGLSATGGTAADIHVVSASPAANNNLANSDYGNTGTTSFGSIASGSWSAIAYNDFSLNASGLANVAINGITKFCSKLSWDVTGTFGGAWLTGASEAFQGYFADQTGTTNDPKLVVTYTTPFIPLSTFM